MVRLVGSFLVRWWQVNDMQRIEVEHIQSGRRGLVASLPEATTWMTDCANHLQPTTADGGAERSVALEGDGEGGATGNT